MFINGDKDVMVPISEPESMCQAMLKVEVKSKFVKLTGAGHDSFNKADADQIHLETLNWLREHLRVK